VALVQGDKDRALIGEILLDGTDADPGDRSDAIRRNGFNARAFHYLRHGIEHRFHWARSIKSEGVVGTATGGGKIPFIHPQYIADVATEVLLSDSYRGCALPITGPQALSYAEMAAKPGAVIGKPIRFASLCDEEARQQQLTWGASAELVEARISIFRAIRAGRLASVTDTVERVLGRKPITFDQWARENAEAFR
jgi:uncharacterized protein YbjT (DUF2867 family)